jgi:hypothetical protein
MNKTFLIALGLGLAAVGLLTTLGVWSNRGSQVRLEASIVKSRIISTDERAAVAVFELRIQNPARVPFVVREVHTTVVDQKGETLTSDPIPQIDLDRVLDYYKQSGPRYNDVLHAKTKLVGGEKKDWTVGASFHVAASVLESRRNFEIVIEDLDGAEVKLIEKR